MGKSRRSADTPFEPDRPRGRHPLVPVLAAAAVGILADRWLPIVITLWWSATTVGLVVWCVAHWRNSNALATAALMVSVAAAFGGWHHMQWYLFGDDDLGRFADLPSRPVCVEGVTTSLPRHIPAPPDNPMLILPRDMSSRVELRLTAIRDGARWRSCSGRTLLHVNGQLETLAVGTRVRVFGDFAAPRPRHNPGEFDLADYARGDRVLARMAAPAVECVVPLDDGDAWSVASAFEELRKRAHDVLWSHIDESQAGLAAAVLLGEREYVDSDQTASYVETGAVHLLSISGLHLGILAGFMFLVLRLGFVPRRLGLLIIAIVVVLYARLTDAQPPVVRSAVMVVTLCAGALLGRKAMQWNTLAAAALVVLAMNPAELFRIGAQLSFLCMAVFAWRDLHAWFRPRDDDPIARLIAQTRPLPVRGLRFAWKWVVDITCTSLVVWLLTLPLVMARFHLCSPIGVALNPLVWLPMSLAMLSGFLVLIVGGFAPPLGDLFGFVCQWNLYALDWVVQGARRMPVGKHWVCGPDDWWLWGFYVAIALRIAFGRFAPPRRWQATLLIGWIGVAFGVGAWRALPSERLEVTFLAVNHGCAVVIRMPDGRTVLYDAGQMNAPQLGARSIAGALWSQGITRVDALMISHSDADHFNAVPGTVPSNPHKSRKGLGCYGFGEV